MIYLMPCIVQNTKDVETLEKRTGLTCHQLPGCTYSVLARSNVILFAKPAQRRTRTLTIAGINWGGGDDAA